MLSLSPNPLPLFLFQQDAGAHYCDITGELSWVASLRDDEQLDAKAKAAGVKVVRFRRRFFCFFCFCLILSSFFFLSLSFFSPSLFLQTPLQVPCCGYDCVPSDLGAFMVAEELKSRGKSVAKIETVVDGSKMDGGGISGGTAASALNLMGDSKAMAVANDPYVCFPPEEAEAKKKKLKAKGVALARPYPPIRLSRRSPALASGAAGSSGWAVSWPLGGANCAVVRRSAALLGYGKKKKEGEEGESEFENEVEVDETVEFPSLKHAALFDAGIASIGAAVFAGSLLPPVKLWLSAKVPQPGTGPSRQKMLEAPWRHAVVATAGSSEKSSSTSSSSSVPPPVSVRGVVGGPQDRGYYMTARMVLEAGLALALEGDGGEKKKEGGKKKDSSSQLAAGILTPAAALGNTLLGRLRAAGFTFEIEK